MADVAIPSGGGGVFVVGTYAGDGARTRTIPLVFTPSAVIISGGGYFTSSSSSAYNALVLAEKSVTFGGEVLAEIIQNGFSVSYTQYNCATNLKGQVYYYLAFR